MYVAAWGLSRDCTFLLEDGKRLSHNPLNVLLLCVGKTEYHVIRVCPEGGLHEVCVCVWGVCVCVCVCVCVFVLLCCTCDKLCRGNQHPGSQVLGSVPPLRIASAGVGT